MLKKVHLLVSNKLVSYDLRGFFFSPQLLVFQMGKMLLLQKFRHEVLPMFRQSLVY